MTAARETARGPAKRSKQVAGLALLATVVVCCKGTLDAGHDNPPPPVTVPVTVAPSATVSGADASVPAPTLEEDASVPATPVVDAGPLAPTSTVEASAPTVVPEASTSLDAGTRENGPLPVDERNPIVLVNDYPSDNWCGELALLAASAELINLVGIVVNTSEYWPDLDLNRESWQSLLEAARASGLQNVPDMVVGPSPRLSSPGDEEVGSTQPNDSMGARFIVDAANYFGTPDVPLVVVNGGTLTDVADAYLLDPTIAERIVVVAAMGWESDEGGAVLGGPNGELDTWAGQIVAQRMSFIQVSGFYSHSEDVPDTRASELPDNAFGVWMADKIDQISNPAAADQVALLSVLVPSFPQNVRRMAYAGSNPQGEALLGPMDDGRCWFVPTIDGSLAADFLWEMLESPSAFSP